MPIYDQGYKRWTGELQEMPLRWWPILRQGVMQFLPQRKYLGLLAVAWVVIVVRGGFLFTRLRGADIIEQVVGSRLGAGPGFFWESLSLQIIWPLIFTIMVGGDLIASDRRNKALQLYFSKPITPNDYVFGKLGVISVFIVASSMIPMLLLWFFGLMIEPTMNYFQQIWFVPLATIAFTAVQIASMGLLMLLMSASAERPVFASVSWFILFGFRPFRDMLYLIREISDFDAASLLSMEFNLLQFGEWLFGQSNAPGIHPAWSLVVLLAFIATCYVLLRRRIRPVEVVL